MLNYNIEGLFNKLDNVDFDQFVNKFDSVCLTETFLNFELNLNAPARKLSHRGRCSEGTLAMIRKCFEQYFERVDVKVHNIVALKMSQALVEVDRIILVADE